MPEIYVEIISVSGHHYVIVVPVAHTEHAVATLYPASERTK